MNTDSLINRSITIITEYYKNNREPFFESISDDVLWIGPAEHQVIRGRQNIIDAWEAEENSLTFTMGDIKAQYVAPHSRVREILLTYDIFTHYPSGNTDMHRQRLHYTWQEKRIRKPQGSHTQTEIVMIHISNVWQYDERDTIYPVHYENMHPVIRLIDHPERFVTVQSSDHTVYRISIENVIYVETVKHSARLQMHTTKGPIIINGTLPNLEKEYPGAFVRIHASYMINPTHMREIRRFSVTLSDGAVLPIPEKKYTKVKKLLLQKADAASDTGDNQ